MLNWFARRRQIKQKQTKKLASCFRPKVEGLEDRTLLSITFPAIGNQTIPEGKTLLLPLSATSSSGNKITYTISSSDPNIAHGPMPIFAPQAAAQVFTSNIMMRNSYEAGAKMIRRGPDSNRRSRRNKISSLAH